MTGDDVGPTEHERPAPPRPTLREAVARLAPGTALRDGLERILRGRTGALIVLGYDDSVEAICDGGFSLDVGMRRPGCGNCTRWTARSCCPPTAAGSCGPTCSWCPDPSIPTDESGTRHRSAERAASQTGYPVISVSHSMSIVTVYLSGERHVLADSATILSRANQAIATLERYKARLDEVSRQLSRAEIEDFVTLRDVMTVVQRLELVRRIGVELDNEVVELGTDGRQLRLQLEELLGGNDASRELIVRDYHANPEPLSKVELAATLDELDSMSDTELLDFTTMAKVFGYPSTMEAQDSAVSSRGYRAMSEIPRLQFAHADRLVRSSARCRACWRPAPATWRPSKGSARSGPAMCERACRSWRSRRSPTRSADASGSAAGGRVPDRAAVRVPAVRVLGTAAQAPGGSGGARMNGTASERRFPSWTTRL